MSGPLDGRRVALAEGRQLEELARLLEREGGIPLRFPMLAILDAPDQVSVQAWLTDLLADRFSHVVFLTGEGVRRLRGAAESINQADAYREALARTRKVTRGPKPMLALRELGLTPDVIAESPTTDGVINSLRNEGLSGAVVGVQLYAADNPKLLEFLASVGATARTVLPYVYAPASDASRVIELIQEMAAGRVDVLVYTSSAQVDRLHEVAREADLEVVLRRGYDQTVVASVGPTMTETLKTAGVRVDIQPEQGFVMKNLVQYIKRYFLENRN